jgi:tetratricopeptide (TPR) repeat protein
MFQAEAQSQGESTACRHLLQHLDARTLGAEGYGDLAKSVLQGGFAATALALLDAGVAQFPAAPELRYWRGNALRLSGQFERAEAELRDVLQSNPAHRDATYSLAHMLREQGRMNAAAAVMTALAQARRDDRNLILAVLRFLCECGAYGQAGEIAEPAATQWPNDAPLRALAGEIRLALGAFAAAHADFVAALERDPGLGAAWLRLVQCQRYTQADDADILRCRAALANPALAQVPRTCAAFALGKALDDLAAFAEAADVLRDANASAARGQPWDASAWQHFVESQIAMPKLPRVELDVDFIPVFIVGLPRSGTTLLASRLGAYDAVCDRGELPWIGAMYNHLRAQRRLFDVDALEHAALLVKTQMQRDDTPAPRWIIDQNPLNFRHLNFIASVFPQARVIICQRATRDTALSIWQQHFAHEDLAFAYSFEAIAQFIRGYRPLTQHWRTSLSLASLDVHYEELVADPDGELQRVADFLGLSGGHAQGAAAAHAIATASVWQARQPIHHRSVARWRNYSAFLPELEALFVQESPP